MQLPGAVRMRPCSLIFLDQVEKAHESVFSAILSVLDHNMFRDHHGRTVDFGDTIVIITSDLGNKEIIACLVDHTFENRKRQSAMNQVKSIVAHVPMHYLFQNSFAHVFLFAFLQIFLVFLEIDTV